MSSAQGEIWIQKQPAPIQNLETLEHQQTPKHNQEKIAPDDMLLMGMMVWMQEGFVSDWLHAGKEDKEEGKEEDEEDRENNPKS